MYIYTPLGRYWITLCYVLGFIVSHVNIKLEDNKQYISNTPRMFLQPKSEEWCIHIHLSAPDSKRLVNVLENRGPTAQKSDRQFIKTVPSHNLQLLFRQELKHENDNKWDSWYINRHYLFWETFVQLQKIVLYWQCLSRKCTTLQTYLV